MALDLEHILLALAFTAWNATLWDACFPSESRSGADSSQKTVR